VAKFTDIVGRHFKQPTEGLGNDNSPVAHMWRTIANPDAPLFPAAPREKQERLRGGIQTEHTPDKRVRQTSRAPTKQPKKTCGFQLG
jgi:hypothetical protein